MLRPPHITHTTWSLAELYLRAADEPSPPPRPDVGAVAEVLRRWSPPPEFLAADRWLSAHLARIPGMPRVFPRPNPRYRTASLDRQLPREGVVIFAVAAPWADDARTVAERSGYAVDAVAEVAGYALMHISPRPGVPQETLVWQGTFLLRDSSKQVRVATAK